MHCVFLLLVAYGLMLHVMTQLSSAAQSNLSSSSGVWSNISAADAARSSIPADDSSRLVAAVEQHVWRLQQNFSCRQPQPFIMLASDVVPHHVKHLIIYPHQTAVMRCANYTGCCATARQQCGPKVREQVAVVFRAVDARLSGNIFISVTLESHRECACVAVAAAAAVSRDSPGLPSTSGTTQVG